MTRRKVVFLIGQLGGGGSERQLHLLTQYMPDEEYEFHVVEFNRSKGFSYREAMIEAGVRVWTIPASRRGVVSRLLWLVSKIRKLNPAVVHSWTFHDNPYAAFAGRLAGVPHRLGSLRGLYSAPSSMELPAVWRWLAVHAIDKTVVNSRAARDQLVERGLRGDRVMVLSNCIEAPNREQRNAIRPADLREYGIFPEHRVAGMIGNLRAVKNHAMFVEGLAPLLKEFPDVRGVITGAESEGEPEIKARLEERIEQLGAGGKIVLTGFRADGYSLMKRFDFFCLTSLSEGTPNALLEAMAIGTPPVATAVGGVPDIVEDGVTGILVDSGDLAGLRSGLRRFLVDPAAARRMGEAAREKVLREFQPSAGAEQLDRFYRRVIGR